MAEHDPETGLDVRLLVDASRGLLGYFVHTWYVKYLEVVVASLRRLQQAGMIADIATPTALGRRVLFDFAGLDLERLSYAVGIHLYILASHKNANHVLMRRHDARQVLYLRGYDFEGSVAAGGGTAMGFSTMQTQAFNLKLRELIGGRFPMFKVMSPKDVYWETVDAQRYFGGDFDGMIRLIRQRTLSLYLNALSWQAGVLDLIDRMDHYVVYVSSLTPSALWELEQLDTDERRGRVTVVFDDAAIANKELQLHLRDRMHDEYGERLIWAKQGGPPTITAAELRERLSARFLVTTPDAFAADIDRHLARIAASAGRLAPGERETWFDFPFHPALPEAELAALRAIADAALARIDASTQSDIACLPLFLTDLQLRIYLTLLMGEHADLGRALAAYGAVMQAALDYYEPPGARIGALSAENREHLLAMLCSHRDYAAYAGVRLLAFGRSHEFADRSTAATAETEAIHARTRAAVDRFFAARGGPLPAPVTRPAAGRTRARR